MTNGTEIPTITDKTEISDNHSLEIEIAALAAVRDICRDITARIVKVAEPKRQIILAGDEALLAAAGYRHLIIQLDLLIDEGEKARAAEVTAPSTPATVAPESLAAITGGLTSLVSILEFFRVETSIKGRDVAINDSALNASLVGALVEDGFDVIRPERIPIMADEGKRELIRRLHRLKAIRADLNAKHPEHPLAIRIDEHLKAIEQKDADQPSLLSRAIGGAHMATLLKQEKPPLVLSSKVETAGGSFTIKKHLWNTLFFGNQLSYGAGAAVSFSLIDGASERILLSDVVYKVNGPGSFKGYWWRLDLSNLGFSPLRKARAGEDTDQGTTS